MQSVVKQPGEDHRHADKDPERGDEGHDREFRIPDEGEKNPVEQDTEVHGTENCTAPKRGLTPRRVRRKRENPKCERHKSYEG
jgi:hypothetical protein